MATVDEVGGSADPSEEVEVRLPVYVPGRERPLGTSLRDILLLLEEVVVDGVLVVYLLELPARHAEAVVEVEPHDSRVDSVGAPGAGEARDEVVREAPEERMLHPANVERLDVAVGDFRRLRAVGLLAVVDREQLGHEVALVLIPAVLVGMPELACLERKLPRVARPCARPFDALLQGDPVEVEVGGGDLARGAVGM